MKRICVLGAAMAALLSAGVVTTAATAKSSNKTKATKPSKAKPVTISCDLKLVVQIPADDVTVTQGAQSGSEYGTAGCAKPLFRGVDASSFTTDDSGDLTGKWQQWFKTGSVYGTYTLIPDDNNPPTTTSFTSASFTGKVTVTNGTGVFKNATGTGTMKCSTPDNAHFSCTQTLKMSQATPLEIVKAS